MICPRCQALLPEPLPDCPGCGWRPGQAPRGAAAETVTVVLIDSTAPLRPAERAWELLAQRRPGSAVLLIALAERRLELAADADWAGRVALDELRAELRERVAPLLAAGGVEPALALAERLMREACGA